MAENEFHQVWKILHKHSIWLDYEIYRKYIYDVHDGICAYLSNVDMTEINLSGFDLSHASFVQCNFSNSDLSKIRLESADLCGSNFSGSNLSQSNLIDANLSQTNLIKSDLSNVHLGDAMLCDANLSEANLTKAKFYWKNGANLSDADLSNSNLSEADLKHSYLVGAKLEKANLQRATLTSSNLSESNLQQCNLVEATLYECDFSFANLSNAKLIGANLFSSIFFQTIMTNADFTNAILCESTMSNLDLTCVEMTAADFTSARLFEVDLSKAVLTKTNFNSAYLADINLSEALLLYSFLGEADLTGAKFINAKLIHANLTGSKLSYSDFSGAYLSHANCEHAIFTSANLTDANLFGTNLSSCKLNYANLQNADLFRANLSNADLRYANLTGANLSEADLTGADLSFAKLQGANFMDSILTNTKFSSDNFDLFNKENGINNIYLFQIISPQIHPPEGMILIPGGTFEMGNVLGDKMNGMMEYEDELPVHSVTLAPFFLGICPVSFNEYNQFCWTTNRHTPKDGGWGKENRPVINTSWHDAILFCNWLSEKEGLNKVYTLQGTDISINWDLNGYRLPTEAEWEYAARECGRENRFGNGLNIATSQKINFDSTILIEKKYLIKGECQGMTAPNGSFRPNFLGLYDMSGNVKEWCWDYYSKDFYKNSPSENPQGPISGMYRVLRGGSWKDCAEEIRVTNRSFDLPDSQSTDRGFRIARKCIV